jgi:glycosyltransferase involved in cell wall biosynthesis
VETLNIAVVSHEYPHGSSYAGAFVQARVDIYRRLGHRVEVYARPERKPIPAQSRPDVIAAHYPLPEFVIPTVKPWYGRVPIVAYLHGAEAIYIPGKHRLWRVKAKSAVKRFLRNCAQSVTESNWMRDRVEEYLGVVPIVIPNPVDPVLFPLMSHGSQNGLCLRGTAWKYGTDLLDNLLSDLNGKGVHVDNLTPGYGRGELPALLGRYGFFVAPSRLEGQGLMACEAAATGMPVVTTHVGGIPEFIADGISVLVNPDDPNALARGIVETHGKLPLTRRQQDQIRESILSRCGPHVTVDKDIELFRRCIELR